MLEYNNNDEELTENEFNNLQQNERFYDLIYYLKKILFWLRIIGIPFLVLLILAIVLLTLSAFGINTALNSLL